MNSNVTWEAFFPTQLLYSEVLLNPLPWGVSEGLRARALDYPKNIVGCNFILPQENKR